MKVSQAGEARFPWGSVKPPGRVMPQLPLSPEARGLSPLSLGHLM